MRKKVTKIKTKVIDAYLLLENPRALHRCVYMSNSIDEMILDFQEIMPDREVSRASILHWKFLTRAEYGLIEKNNAQSLFNKEQEQERSVANTLNQGTKS